ncbi:hypothetical protein JHK85_029752 [Glycine max]|nr:hypothetical protein JHK85_029752 [Glycine max]
MQDIILSYAPRQINWLLQIFPSFFVSSATQCPEGRDESYLIADQSSIAVEARTIGEGLEGESLLICSPLEAVVHSESDRKLTVEAEE